MKKALKILAVIVGVAVVWFGARWVYYVYEYGQHLPEHAIAVNGVDRAYHLFTPTDNGNKPNSLLVMLQGGSAGSWRLPQQFDWEALAEKEGIIIAIPIGKLLPPNEGAWQLNTDADSMQDIDYIEAMIDEVSSNHSVDSSRVYAVGYSLGSMFSYEFACQMSTRIAAIASFAGTMPVSQKSCDPQRNVPIMHVHGLEDPIIAYSNTWDWKAWDSVGTMRDIPGLVRYWTDRYNCQNQVETTGETATHFVYDNCEQGSSFEHYRLEKGDHDWPAVINGEPTYSVMWTFLKKHTLP